MNSKFSQAFLSIMKRLDTMVPEIKHIDQDMGQLEGNSTRPDVAFPCTLVDFAGFTYTDFTINQQIGIGEVVIKMGFAQITPSSNIVEAVYRDNAMQFYELEQKVHEALHGWSPGDEFGTLTRTAVNTYNRLRGVRIREIRYRLEFEDNSTKPKTRVIPKPPLEVKVEKA